MASKAAARAPLSQLQQSLASGSKLSSSIQSIRVSAGRPHRQLLKQALPALAFSNPSIDFQVEYLPSPRPKTKDPKILERNEAISQRIEAAQEGKAEGDVKKSVDVLSEVVLGFRDGPPRTISLNGISSAEALKQIQAAAGVKVLATASASEPSARAAANESESAAAASSVSDGSVAAA